MILILVFKIIGGTSAAVVILFLFAATVVGAVAVGVIWKRKHSMEISLSDYGDHELQSTNDQVYYLLFFCVFLKIYTG